MPVAFIFFILLGLVALILFGVSRVFRRKGDAKVGSSYDSLKGSEVALIFKVASAVFGGIAIILLLVSSVSFVGTQNIGIVTSFGRPSGHLGNGAHFIAPWEQVTQMDGAIQTDSYGTAQSGVTPLGPCINVRMAGQQTACVNVSIKWRIDPNAIDTLFKNYSSSGLGVFGNIRDSLVYRELQVALNEQFQGYDPIASLTSSAREGQAGNPTVAQLAAKVTQQMQGDLNGQVEVSNVLVPNLTYDASVQSRINTVLAQAAQTDVAKLAIQTALAQATANRDISASISSNPNVLINQCLNLENEAEKTGYVFQIGFSCNLFGNSGVGVIAGSTGGK